MSNILRVKNGNLSKVKYFLPGYRNQPEEVIVNSKPKPAKQSASKKQPYPNPHHASSITSNGDISF